MATKILKLQLIHLAIYKNKEQQQQKLEHQELEKTHEKQQDRGIEP